MNVETDTTWEAPPVAPCRSIRILGVRADDADSAEALSIIDGFVRDGGTHQIVTVNVEFIMAAQRDEAFRRIINGASLVLPDGIGVVWASRLLGNALRERVGGTDMVSSLSHLAATESYGIFLLGAAPGVAELAAQDLCTRYPGLRVLGTYAGSPLPEEEDHIVARIRRAKPDLLFVAYGAPRQDKWIHRNLSRLGVPVAMGVGGAFDFISGRAMRAPRWIQQLGLEWVHRLIREPWRWRRMLALPRFVCRILVDRALGRL